MQVNESKETLRHKNLQIRRSLLPNQKSEMDARITQRVLTNEAYLAAQTVFCYVSLPHEVDTHAILADAWSRGKRVAVPRCRTNGRMDFYTVSSPDDLSSGTFGIPEPNESCPLCLPHPNDLCLVPCLSTDERGFRLGYGGGYYDRYLAAHPVRTLGLCYALCLANSLPVDPFDIPMELVISDKEV